MFLPLDGFEFNCNEAEQPRFTDNSVCTGPKLKIHITGCSVVGNIRVHIVWGLIFCTWLYYIQVEVLILPTSIH